MTGNLKRKSFITPEAKVVIAGSLSMSFLTPFFLAFVLLRVPVGEKKNYII